MGLRRSQSTMMTRLSGSIENDSARFALTNDLPSCIFGLETVRTLIGVADSTSLRRTLRFLNCSLTKEVPLFRTSSRSFTVALVVTGINCSRGMRALLIIALVSASFPVLCVSETFSSSWMKRCPTGCLTMTHFKANGDPADLWDAPEKELTPA